MAVSNVVVKIKDDEWSFNTLTAGKGLAVLKKLSKVVAPSFSAMMQDGETEIDLASNGLQVAVQLLVENMDKVDVEALIKDLVRDAKKNGQPVVFDMEFAANYRTLLTLVTEVVKANYGDVFTSGDLA